MTATVQKTHISDIRQGDTVIHNGILTTVCGNNIKRDPFMGTSIFGDCYHSGHKPVLKVTSRVMPMPSIALEIYRSIK